MKIGDLIHAPRYPFWGLGIVVDREEEADGMVCIQWFDDDLDVRCNWQDRRDLEVL
jgi:hypothetical protein